MNPIRRRMVSLLTEAALARVEALDPASVRGQELSKICDADRVIKEDIQKICDVITLAELTKIFHLTRRMKKTSGKKKETIKRSLQKIAEVLITRAEAESGPLKLPQACRHILMDI